MTPDHLARHWPGALLRTAAQGQAMTLAVTLLLAACAPRPEELPLPAGAADRPDLTMPRTAATDASVPSASSVFDAPVAAAAAGPAASAPQARAHAEMSPAQESRAMPLPGQANDHSVPTVPPQPAASR